MQNTILLTKEKVLRDPIHNYIYLQHQVIVDLINTREFQRLRRIKQLGTTNLTFHGAEHSRFTHSVGVYEITRRICDLFLRNYPSKSPNDGLWNDDERLVALCAALLHDLGHGAYSHTFEHIFKTNHEEMTVAIITNPETQINQVLKNVAPDFPEKVASVITKTYPNPQVVQMISSQIDADRMDYLLRDSYFTGANYGTFDLTRILRVMRPDSKGIIFDINGMHAVEDYIVSRFQMYQQVYFHPVSRAMEVILDHLLSRAHHLFEDGKLNDPLSQQFLHPFFNGTFTLQNYLALDDGILNTCFELWRNHDDPVLSNLATRFLDRQPFKSVKTSMETQALLPELRQLVTDAGFDPLYYTAVNDSFDLPYDVYNPRKDKKPTQIRLRQKDGSTAELSQESALVKAITGRQSGDERFFFPKEMLAQNQNLDIFMPVYLEFAQHIKNDHIV
ncbi:HD domain-containing protein [Ligilactobacillus equi]|uniref:HD family metal-dependent phosphohydrolase n=2 Tax=Ligilactobacillus equi TaxID=137357 RepID=V7HVR6_9LACO|nr:HD domain-containing protein [Ligilactobacillus equi]ETA73987.1 HD family metal-dependent phosphohydrolase [Ligilactobacillus equi DPC 6820]KRL82475.1 HD family metal-dependent phosphohydrolase [Ligilactobacillus equi DSM 15833 = JCM 10991]MCQ2556718.1 HD domain-containing protein [Ligilactobacillus sp.]